MIEAIRFINVTPPPKKQNEIQSFTRGWCGLPTLCQPFLLPCEEEGGDQASGERRAARSHVRDSPEGRGVEPSFRMRV